MYQAIRKTLNSKPLLVPYPDNLEKYLDEADKDYYVSLYQYNQEHVNKYNSSNTLSGIKDNTTDKLFFDFDSENNIEKAAEDTLEVVNRLIEKHNIPLENIHTYFSGYKGFSLELKLDKRINREQFEAATHELAGDLETFDTSVSDNQRIIRLVNTKHNKSGLYKIAVSPQEIADLSTVEIKSLASTNRKNIHITKNPIHLDEGLFEVVKEESKEISLIPTDINWSTKPKWLSNCKFAIMKGYIQKGSRSDLLMALASTLKNQGFDEENTYGVLKGATRLASLRYSEERFDNEELYNNIIKQVYSPQWKNGQYTCREPGALKRYCEAMGDHKCKHDTHKDLVKLDLVSDKFALFAKELDNNIIKTGIQAIDNRVMLSTSMLVGLLGSPSSGKTQTSFHLLNHNSKQDIGCLFFSMDMGLPLVYTRLIQKHRSLSKEQIFNIYKNNPKEAEKLNQILAEEYKNVNFCFRSGLSMEDIKNTVNDQQQNSSKKVKLVVIDYLECISGPYSDSTANTALIAQQLKDVANDLETCVLLLLQTQKMSGDPSEPLLSMRQVKGSSAIEQACSVILSISRPGFSPRSPENDRFMTISSVKDRMGPLMSVDCGFDGLTGAISYPLDFPEQELLGEIRARKAVEKEMEKGL